MRLDLTTFLKLSNLLQNNSIISRLLKIQIHLFKINQRIAKFSSDSSKKTNFLKFFMKMSNFWVNCAFLKKIWRFWKKSDIFRKNLTFLKKIWHYWKKFDVFEKNLTFSEKIWRFSKLFDIFRKNLTFLSQKCTF